MNRKLAKIMLCVLLMVMLLALAACGGGGGSDDPNVGTWKAVSTSMLGMEMEVAELFENGVTLELKSNGKFTIDVSGENGNGKWEYDGDALNFSASDADMTGVIKDGMLTLTNLLGMGIDITFEKEGGYSAGQSEGGKTTPKDAGYYIIDSITEDGKTFDSASLSEMGIAYYILLSEDGTAEISTDSTTQGTWTPGKLRYQEDGEDVVSNYTLDKDLLTIELGDGITLVFKRSDETPPAAGRSTLGDKPDGTGVNLTDLQQWWNGDWYGYIYLPTADGAWEELEDGFWDCFGTIESDATGFGSIYLWDDGGELADVDLQITEQGLSAAGAAMSEGGTFNKMTIGHADWIIDPGTNTQPYEHLLIIDGTFEDPDGSEYGGFDYEIWLRPWGMLWDDFAMEEQPPGYYDWYLDRYTGSMPTMSEFLSGAEPQPNTGGGSSFEGKFVDPENSENWVEFKSGGKVTTSLEGTVFDGTFKVDGDKVTCTMTFLGAESVEEYLLSNDGKTLTDQSWLAIVYHLE